MPGETRPLTCGKCTCIRNIYIYFKFNATLAGRAVVRLTRCWEGGTWQSVRGGCWGVGEKAAWNSAMEPAVTTLERKKTVHFHKSNNKFIHEWVINLHFQLSDCLSDNRLPNVVQLMIWLKRGRPCFSCKLECVRDGTYAHTATWSICTVQEPRLYFFFVIYTIKCKSKSVETLPGEQTAVCHLDVWFSATRRPGSRLKWRESIHHRRSWEQVSHLV